MNVIRQRLKALRLELLRRGLDAFYISGTDPHASEYLPERWLTRQFISGFTGSYGVVVVTHEEAGLWTDSRYFIQAEEQLKGSGIKMYKTRVPEAVSPEQWLSRKLSRDSKVGFDPQTLTVNAYRYLSENLNSSGIVAVETSDIFEKLWEGRPGYSRDAVYELDSSVAGMTQKAKKEAVVAELKLRDAHFQVITALDELAWLFNLRGSDIAYNPVFTGYGVVGKNEWILFVDPGKVPQQVKHRFEKEKISMMGYDDFFSWLQGVHGKRVFLDPSTVSYAVFSSLQSDNKLVEGLSPVSLLKAQKNEAELNGFREAMKKDGVALLEFLYWLHTQVGSEGVTEYSAGRKLATYRAQQADYVGESFPAIMGYREHGAIVHLNVGEEEALPLQPEGILLFDSGGQYRQGTTDITRTVALGAVTARQKTDYTLVLKGMIALSRVQFPAGTRGCNIDVLARLALWEQGLNYGHGTGHGVGHFLNVHEGPASIRQDLNEIALLPGMVFSNEPGLYRQGEYGIRIENLMVCVEKEETGFGKFYGFETLTLCPVDLDVIDDRLLTAAEKEWLNGYHRSVRKTLKPLVQEQLHSFLEMLTREI